VVTSRVLSVFFQVSSQYDRACWSRREVVFMLQCGVLWTSSGGKVQVSSTFSLHSRLALLSLIWIRRFAGQQYRAVI
jgi:hypothetical protein